MKLRHWLTTRAVLLVWLATVWVLLWGSLTFANLVTGVLAAAAVVLAFPPERTNDDPFVARPVAAVAFLVWFLKGLVLTNLAVAREVLTPTRRSRIRTAIVAVPLRTTSGRLATVVANAVTLTPGTLSVDARGRPAVLYVHVLSYVDEATTRAEVVDLEQRVVRAFGTRAERARICGRGGSQLAEDAPTHTETRTP